MAKCQITGIKNTLIQNPQIMRRKGNFLEAWVVDDVVVVVAMLLMSLHSKRTINKTQVEL